MTNPTLSSLGHTLARLHTMILVVGLLYAACIGTGIVMDPIIPDKVRTILSAQQEQSARSVEKVFGRFREPVRQGDWATIAACSGLVFLINLCGDFLQFTLLNVLLAPVFFTLGLGGWMQGLSLSHLHASSGLSLILFLLMVGLEWITYVLATTAGINIGLSVLMPHRQNTETRRVAFKRAWSDAGRIYLLIGFILAVQAVFEILYVRKVLLMGGSAVPLMPY